MEKIFSNKKISLLSILMSLVTISSLVLLFTVGIFKDKNLITIANILQFLGLILLVVSIVILIIIIFNKLANLKNSLILLILEFLLLYYHWFVIKPYISLMNSILNPTKNLNGLMSIFGNAKEISSISQSEMAMYFTFGTIVVVLISIFIFCIISFIGKFKIYETEEDAFMKEYDNDCYNLDGHNNKQKEPFEFTKRMKICLVVFLLLIISFFSFIFIKNYISDMNKTKISILNNLSIEYKRDATIINEEDEEKDVWSGFASISVENKVENKNKDIQGFLNEIKYTIKEENKRLKNGDKVTITLDYDKEKANKLKIKLINDEKTVEVKGLKEMPEKASDIKDEMIESLNTNCKNIMEEKYSKNGYSNLEYFNMGNSYKKFSGGNVLETVYDIKYKYNNFFIKQDSEYVFSCSVNDIESKDKETKKEDVKVSDNVLFKDTESYFKYLKELNEISEDTEFFNE